MKLRKMIGLDALDEIEILVKHRFIPISSALKVVGIDKELNYRTAYNIVAADLAGHRKATRPVWLECQPMVQKQPEDWYLLNGLTAAGKWSQ